MKPTPQTILCIDDEEIVLESLEMELSEAMGGECTFEFAQSGNDALMLMNDLRNAGTHIAVIVCDYIMPEMKGDEVLSRAHQVLPETRKIMLTGQSSFEGVTNAINGAHLYRYLTKPWDKNDLVMTLREALRSFTQQQLLDEQRAQLEQQNRILIALNASLEQKVVERTQEIEVERQKSEHLLQNMLPAHIALRLKAGETTIAEKYDHATVLFADIVGFTKFSQITPPEFVVAMLNVIFSDFDALAAEFQLEKIKTIGDCYMVCGGLNARKNDHVKAVADMALRMIEHTERAAKTAASPIHIRIGIHTGAVVAGVIGTQKYAYDLWGDTVNTASRLESHGETGRIHISEAVQRVLKGKYWFEERGSIEIKGRGALTTYFLIGPV
jgi:class 3 adenylate cyclase